MRGDNLFDSFATRHLIRGGQNVDSPLGAASS